MENLRKLKIDSEEFTGMEQRSEGGPKITVFVYFNSKETVEKLLKTHSRSLDGRRYQVQQATVNNTKSANKKVSFASIHFISWFVTRYYVRL